VEWLEAFLLDFRGVLVFVAHDRVFMDTVGTHVLYLGLSRPIFRKTSYTSFLALQAEYDAQRERQAKAVQEEITRKMAFVDRFRYKASTARQAGSQQKMAKRLEKELEGLRPEPKRKELAFTWPEAPHCEKVVMAASELAFRFADGHSLWPALTFTLFRGDKVALVGSNGSGKSTLLKLLAGQLDRASGNVVTASQARIGYFTQHRADTLREESTVIAEMRRLSDPHTTEEELRSVLGLFLLGQDFFDRQVGTLSGGEKSRLVLASLFLMRCNCLLLDEPTNHLDLESREALIGALQRYSGTLLMVAHDRWLLTQVGAQVWEMDAQGLTPHDDFGAYDAVRKARLREPSGDVAEPEPERRAVSREEAKRIKREEAERRNAAHRQLKPLQESYGKLEKELEEAMAEQAEVEQLLVDPAVYADQARSTELLQRFDDARRRSEKLMERMTEIEEKMAALG
jgi:ATP-binding cassette subfamily F protein 3